MSWPPYEYHSAKVADVSCQITAASFRSHYSQTNRQIAQYPALPLHNCHMPDEIAGQLMVDRFAEFCEMSVGRRCR